jgi:hypothetical protein
LGPNGLFTPTLNRFQILAFPLTIPTQARLMVRE